VLLVLLVLPLLRGPQGERNGDVRGSMQQDEECDGQQEEARTKHGGTQRAGR
jgi:hypothetical protein